MSKFTYEKQTVGTGVWIHEIQEDMSLPRGAAFKGTNGWTLTKEARAAIPAADQFTVLKAARAFLTAAPAATTAPAPETKPEEGLVE